jgi:hypothetical protein
MRYLKTFESMADLAGDSYNKRQERLRVLSDMSLELWDENFNVQVSSEVLSRDDKYIVVNIVKRGQNRFDYTDIKDTFLSMVSYMESEGHSISIDVSDKYVSNLIPVELKGDELCLKHRVSRIDGYYLMVDYPIGQLIIKFKE